MTCEARDIPTLHYKVVIGILVIEELTKEIQCCTQMTGDQPGHREVTQMGKDI